MNNWRRLCFYSKFSSLLPCKNTFVGYASKHELYHTTLIRFTIPNSTKMDEFSCRIIELDNTSIKPLLNRLNKLNQNCVIDDIIHDQVLPICQKRLSQFTNEELLIFMELLCCTRDLNITRFRKNSMIYKLLCDLSGECYKRSKSLNMEIVITMLEAYCKLKQNSSFLHYTFRRFHKRIHNKPLHLFIRFIKTINKCRYWIKDVHKPFEIHYYLERNLEKLNSEQIMNLVEASKQMVRPFTSFELKKKLFLYFTDNFETMDDYCRETLLNCFCFVEAFTINMKQFTPQFSRVVDTFNEKIDSFSFNSVTCVGTLCTRFLLHHPEFLEKLYRRLLKEGSSVKISQTAIDSSIYSLIFFNFQLQDEDVYSNMLKVRETTSLKTNPFIKRYIRSLCWLSFVGIYNYEIMNDLFDEQLLIKTYKELNKFTLHPYPFILQIGIEIECPDYTGNQMTPKLRDDIANSCYNWELKHFIGPKRIDTDHYQLTDDRTQSVTQTIMQLPYYKILQEISSILNSHLNMDFSHLCYILPQFPRPNLLFGFNSTNPVNLSHLQHQDYIEWKNLDPSVNWYIVTVLINNSLLTNDAIPLGDEIAKTRQFQKLGFTVISVIQDDWLNMNNDQKFDFCKHVLPR